MKTLEIDETTRRKAIVKSIFEDANNYMKNGTYLRQLVNLVNEMNFDEIEERHAFNDIYERLLRGLQTAGNNGQYFTPRALTEFTAEMVDIKIGDTVADCRERELFNKVHTAYWKSRQRRLRITS